MDVQIKDLGKPFLIVGMAIERDADTSSISLLQCAYLKHVLDHFGMGECNPHATPLLAGIQLTEAMSPQTEADRFFMADKPYRKLLGSLMWAQVATHPNLLYAVGLLAHFQSNLGPAHWNAMLHMLRYIKGTLNYHITYSKQENKSIKPIGYVNADFSGDHDTRRLTGGYVFMIAGGAVS